MVQCVNGLFEVNEYCSRGGGVLSLRFKARSSSSVASAIEVDLFLRNPYFLLFSRLLLSMCV